MPPVTVKAPPRFVHDCTMCRYIGQIHMYDLYVCESDCDHDITVLARYDDSGPGYASVGFMGPKIEAVKREIGGLEGDQAVIIAIFRNLPSLLLNIFNKQNRDNAETAKPPTWFDENEIYCFEVGYQKGKCDALRGQ
jgi:hypothetical protein